MTICAEIFCFEKPARGNFFTFLMSDGFFRGKQKIRHFHIQSFLGFHPPSDDCLSWAVHHYDSCYKNTRTHAIAYMFCWTGAVFNPIRDLFKKLSVAVQSEETLKRDNTKFIWMNLIQIHTYNMLYFGP